MPTGNIFSPLLAAGPGDPLYQKGEGKTKHLLVANFKCDDTSHTVNTLIFSLFIVTKIQFSSKEVNTKYSQIRFRTIKMRRQD